MTAVTISIDCMGGDFGPSVMIPSACEAMARHANLSLLLVGHPEQIEAEIAKVGSVSVERYTIVKASQTIEMDEKPSQALRKKSDSSMAVALNKVTEGNAQACVSAGNTGALMALSRSILKTVPGVSRPAIISEIPTEKGRTRVVDLGANVDCSPDQLYQFALMGSALVSAVDQIKQPTVGLLNNGTEEIKGNVQTRATANLLQQSPYLNYSGYIEANDVYRGSADIIVCDGFVGNVFAKASEGTVRMLTNHLYKEFKRNFLTRILSVIVRPVLNACKNDINPDRHNGASFIGLQGIVIKSHGAANKKATLSAIEEAIREVENNVPAKISEQLQQQLKIED